MDLSKLWTDFIMQYGWFLLGLLVLVVLDFISGALAALKTHTFDLKKLADYFASSVIPLVFGWAVLSIFAYALGAIPKMPEQISMAIGPGVAYTSFVTIALMLTASIVSNLNEIGVLPKQVAAPAVDPVKPVEAPKG
jgi:hypothetical protein